MADGKPDLTTIAQLAGVSTTSVHCALNSKPGVSEATRARVLRIAREVGYRPNRLAQSLRRQRSATLGVIASDLSGTFFAQILEGLESEAQTAEYAILLAFSHSDPAQERALAELFLEKAVDGLLVYPCDPEENSRFFSKLATSGFPLVFVDRYMPSVPVDAVCTDNLQAGYVAGRHLVERGSRRVVFLTVLSHERGATSVRGRLEGLNQALREAGLPPAVEIGPQLPDQQRLAYHAFRDFLTQGGEVDGVLGANATCAHYAVEVLTEFGRAVPAEVPVVGFDELDPETGPRTTSLLQPLRQIGQEAVRLLLSRLERGDQGLPPRRILLTATLVVR